MGKFPHPILYLSLKWCDVYDVAFVKKSGGRMFSVVHGAFANVTRYTKNWAIDLAIPEWHSGSFRAILPDTAQRLWVMWPHSKPPRLRNSVGVGFFTLLTLVTLNFTMQT